MEQSLLPAWRRGQGFFVLQDKERGHPVNSNTHYRICLCYNTMHIHYNEAQLYMYNSGTDSCSNMKVCTYAEEVKIAVCGACAWLGFHNVSTHTVAKFPCEEVLRTTHLKMKHLGVGDQLSKLLANLSKPLSNLSKLLVKCW